jgi:hypothetical protein
VLPFLDYHAPVPLRPLFILQSAYAIKLYICPFAFVNLRNRIDRAVLDGENIDLDLTIHLQYWKHHSRCTTRISSNLEIGIDNTLNTFFHEIMLEKQ